MADKLYRPVLRWPGNKYALLSNIIKLTPSNYCNYHEPFLGAGAVFFNLTHPQKAYLSDCNNDLINFYCQVKCNLPELLSLVSSKRNSETYYYKERDTVYNSPIKRAAQFYYLNRTCFNGIYRVNSKGKFNVPYGKRTGLVVADAQNLSLLQTRLQCAELHTGDFFSSIDFISPGDFVYLDPPYRAVNHSNFLMYNEKLFSWEDQIRLHAYCKLLIDRNVKFVLSNHYDKEIYRLFGKDLNLKSAKLRRYSGVGSKLECRGEATEYLFFR